jgi:hypothetical protein
MRGLMPIGEEQFGGTRSHRQIILLAEWQSVRVGCDGEDSDLWALANQNVSVFPVLYDLKPGMAFLC